MYIILIGNCIFIKSLFQNKNKCSAEYLVSYANNKTYRVHLMPMMIFCTDMRLEDLYQTVVVGPDRLALVHHWEWLQMLQNQYIF